MNMLVTGASGGLGRNILPLLSSYFTNIYELTGSNSKILSSSKEIISNLTDSDLELKLDQVISNNKIDFVLHMAAYLFNNDINDWSQNIYTNILGTHRLLQWAIHRDVTHFYFTSSYIHLNSCEKPFQINSTFNPKSPYAASKLFNEIEIASLCKKFNIRYVILRIPSYYGPFYIRYWTVLPQMIKTALLNKIVEVYGSGTRTMNFIHTNDIVSAIIKSIETSQEGVFHLGSKRSVSMLELSEIIKTHIPNIKIIKNKKIDPQDGKKFEVDISETIRVLNWTPYIDISEGITDVIKAVKNSLGLLK